MNIHLLKDVLDELTTVDINEVVLEPSDSGGTLIRGANKAQNIIIFDELEDKLVELPVAIQSVRGLYSRLQLFDLSKASIKTDDGDKYMKGLTIKQGKKSATYRTANPKLLGVPTQLPPVTVVGDEIVFEKDYVTYLLNAFQSLAMTGNKEERKLSIEISGGELSLSIFDGEDDSFNDTMSVEGEDIPKASWELEPFRRVLKQSIECTTDNTARLTITDFGIAIFAMQPLSVIVAPMTS